MKTSNSLSAYDVLDIIERIKLGRQTSDDLNRIINHLYTANNIDVLMQLLNSEDDNVLGNGIYILSEIGKSGTPLRNKAGALLNHPDVQIRYWAMNSVVSCFEAKIARNMISAAGLLNDPDEFVRVRAREMLGVAR